MKLVLNKFYILQFQRYFLKKYLIECNIYEKFLHNVNLYGAKLGVGLFYDIDTAFLWDLTPEGIPFWLGHQKAFERYYSDNIFKLIKISTK